eukprot:6196336-Pleurochrysis_carterae.AAC.2
MDLNVQCCQSEKKREGGTARIRQPCVGERFSAPHTLLQSRITRAAISPTARVPTAPLSFQAGRRATRSCASAASG